MIAWLYWTAAAMAVTGGLAGNRLAWPLLLSAAFCLYVRATALPFDLELWVTVDLVVMILALTVLLNEVRKHGWRMTWREWVVGGLFLPMWASYVMAEGPAHVVSSLAGAAQFLLVMPRKAQWVALFERWKANLRHRDKWTDFDLRAVHGSRA